MLLRTFNASATAAILLVTTPAFAAKNIVVNGGFENNSNGLAPPWIFTTAGNVPPNLAGAYGSNSGFGSGFAHSGSSEAYLGLTINNGFGRRSFDGTADQAVVARQSGVYRLNYFALDLSATGTTTYTVTATLDGRALTSTVVKPSGATVADASSLYQKITKTVQIRRGQSDLGLRVTRNENANDSDSQLFVDDVSLTLVRKFGKQIDFANASLTQNELAVAAGVYRATNQRRVDKGPFYRALSEVSDSAAPAVLSSLSGEGISAAQNVAHRSSEMFTSAIFDQTTFYGSANTGNSITLTEPVPGFTTLAPDQTLAASAKGRPVRELADLPASRIEPAVLAPQRTWRAWASGFGGTEDIHGDAATGSARQDNTIYGGSLGVDYQLLPNYLLGVAVGGTNGDFRVADRGTFGSTTGGHIAVYDIASFGAFYGASSSAFSYYTNRSTRFVSGFGGLGNETERGDFDSHEFRQRLEFGRHLVGYGGTITPFIALEIADLRSNGFAEQAVSGPGLFGLNVNGQSIADVPSFVGARYQSLMALGNGMTFSPSLQLAYVHEFAPYRSQTNTIADLPGATFLVDGARPARNAAQVKAGGEIALGPHTSLFASFDGEFSGADQLYTGTGGFRYVW